MYFQDAEFLPPELVHKPHLLKIVIELKASRPPHVLKLWMEVNNCMLLPVRYLHSVNFCFSVSDGCCRDHETVTKLR